MNIALILAAGVGQRMRNAGLPKQFLKLMGKPIIIYTLEKFENSSEIDKIVVVCHGSYIEYMENLLKVYRLQKVDQVIVGGSDRQSSLLKGLAYIQKIGGKPNDIVVIHDGVRPMVSIKTIEENIQTAGQYGCAITVHPVTESVIVTASEKVKIADFKKRADTFSLTSPQSFQFGKIWEAYQKNGESEYEGMPLLDAAMVYSNMGGIVHLVKEQDINIKVTTPVDFYYLRALLELEENKYIFGM